MSDFRCQHYEQWVQVASDPVMHKQTLNNHNIIYLWAIATIRMYLLILYVCHSTFIRCQFECTKTCNAMIVTILPVITVLWNTYLCWSFLSYLFWSINDCQFIAFNSLFTSFKPSTKIFLHRFSYFVTNISY